MSDFDLIVADIDGTLINDEKRLSALTIATIRRVRRDFGVDVLLASSRMPQSIRQIQIQLGCLDAIVALDGALVVDGRDDKADVVLDRRLPVETSRDIVRMAMNARAHVGIFRGNEWVVGKIDYWTLREIRGNNLMPAVDSLLDRLSIWGDAQAAAHKIMIRGSASQLRALRRTMSQFEAQVLFSFGRPTAMEIVTATAGKWAGVKFMLDRLGIRPERVMAFGDSDNDFELLSSVGHGVAPTNASGRIRKVAREVTLSNAENGVAAALNKYFPEL